MIRNLTRKFGLKKVNRTPSEILKRELENNPEFDKAFPHLMEYK